MTCCAALQRGHSCLAAQPPQLDVRVQTVVGKRRSNPRGKWATNVRLMNLEWQGSHVACIAKHAAPLLRKVVNAGAYNITADGE